MKFRFPNFPMLIAFLVFVTIAVKLWKKSKIKSKLPPGPRKLPIIGNLHQLSSSLPHHNLRNLSRKYGPIMHLQLGEVSAVVVSSPQVAKEVTKIHDLIFANRPQILVSEILGNNSPNLSFSPYGPIWRQLRKVCVLELLNAKRVQSFESIREEEVENLIEAIISLTPSQVPFDISKLIFSMTNNITARAAFGKKCKHKDEFIAAMKTITELAGGFDIPDIFPSFKILHSLSGVKPALDKIHQMVDKILENIIEEHIENRKGMSSNMLHKEDLVDVLLRVQESGDLEIPISRNTLKAVILEMFIGGTDTSSTVLEWAISEMMKKPQVMEKAQAEVRKVLEGKSKITEPELQQLDYMKMVIKETLRMHPPLPLLLPREAGEKCEIGGYDIPPKTKVIINAWAIGRHPEHWKNAECFEPERFQDTAFDFKGTNLEYIPFGAGRRICPGTLFGIANVELPLAKLLFHFDWKLPDGIEADELDMTETFGATAGRKNDLYLVAKPYISKSSD
ncbi:desmethyl-deoxy-podophyllotoxin synthase-like [Lycium barbarum]|uniref:desmethyl-deoxy-podophyllotoxin synthase-like n=1 Tax=Lycium barbarum TaxID=112863 RepID=UPI00293E99D0|nr:desmethyl-deoxy-podophyllotoxin synthase-like [Lycium barbarum]